MEKKKKDNNTCKINECIWMQHTLSHDGGSSQVTYQEKTLGDTHEVCLVNPLTLGH